MLIFTLRYEIRWSICLSPTWDLGEGTPKEKHRDERKGLSLVFLQYIPLYRNRTLIFSWNGQWEERHFPASLAARYGHVSWDQTPVKDKQKQDIKLLGMFLKRRTAFLAPFSFPSASWNMNIIAGTLAANFDHEFAWGMEVTPGRESRLEVLIPWRPAWMVAFELYESKRDIKFCLSQVILFCFWQPNQSKLIQAIKKKEKERKNSRRQSDFMLVRVLQRKLERGRFNNRRQVTEKPEQPLGRISFCKKRRFRTDRKRLHHQRGLSGYYPGYQQGQKIGEVWGEGTGNGDASWPGCWVVWRRVDQTEEDRGGW